MKSSVPTELELQSARLWLASLTLLAGLEKDFFSHWKKAARTFDENEVHDLRVASRLQAQQALMESEKRTAAALASLASIASLKEEERGLVLTLTGSVLFQSGKSTLMPPARAKLDQVAEALQAIQARNLIVEGHTDSQGSDASNQGLSQRRADAVGDYLVQRGYPANRIRSLGQGEGSPVAKNDSAEGRANNRRVEIVIQRELRSSNP